MNNGIALPTEEHCRTWPDIEKWKSLSTEDFMAQYGNAKRLLYKLPTEEELDMLKEMDDDDDN